MIVDSMTYDEILDLHEKDRGIIARKMEEYVPKVRRWYKKTKPKERTYYPTIRFQSAKGFHYVMMIYYKGKGEDKEEPFGIHWYCWYVQKKGMYGIVQSMLGGMVSHKTIITPHFLDRYRERFLKDLSMDKADVLHHFIMNNSKQPSRNIESKKYPGCHYKICNDGLCLCHKLTGLDIEAKTFITWDMAGNDQKAIALEGKKLADILDFELNLPFDELD